MVRVLSALLRDRSRARTARCAIARRGCDYVAADGLRHRLSAADPSDRRDQAQGPQQHARPPGPTTPGSPWAIGSARRRPQSDASAARHARGFSPLRGSARASTASKSRSTSRSSARRIIRTCRSIRNGFASGPTARVQYAENPPKKYQDIYPFNFEIGRLAGAVAGARGRVRLLDRRRRDASSASTIRTPSRSRSGSG